MGHRGCVRYIYMAFARDQAVIVLTSSTSVSG